MDCKNKERRSCEDRITFYNIRSKKISGDSKSAKDDRYDI